jgi:hypothetical protein
LNTVAGLRQVSGGGLVKPPDACLISPEIHADLLFLFDFFTLAQLLS